MKNKFSHIDIANNVNNLRLAGHKLSMEWSGQFGADSISTGTCSCGKGDGGCVWQESASNQREVRAEYRRHLAKAIFQRKVKQLSEELGYDDFDAHASKEDWGLLRIRCRLDILKVGGVMRLSEYHWIVRKEKNVYISSFVNLVGGEVSERFKNLDEAYQYVCSKNEDMIKLGRLV